MSVTRLRRFSDPISDWKHQINPVVETISVGAIKFVSATEGWITFTPGGLLHTTDGGTTWAEKIVHPTDILSESTYLASNLSFINASTGWGSKNSRFEAVTRSNVLDAKGRSIASPTAKSGCSREGRNIFRSRSTPTALQPYFSRIAGSIPGPHPTSRVSQPG